MPPADAYFQRFAAELARVHRDTNVRLEATRLHSYQAQRAAERAEQAQGTARLPALNGATDAAAARADAPLGRR